MQEYLSKIQGNQKIACKFFFTYQDKDIGLCQVPVNSWISSAIPEILPRLLAGLGIELDHLARRERKFEQYMDSVDHSCLHQCQHHLLNSTPFLSYSPQYPLVLHQECCRDGVGPTVSRLMTNLAKNFHCILIIVTFNSILLYSSSHQYD